VNHKAYTPAQDAAILAAPRGGMATLAAEYGKSTHALNARRAYLINGSATQPMHQRLPQRERKPPPPGPFARPSFFEEDLEALARGSR
jgi:hypothetical protein